MSGKEKNPSYSKILEGNNQASKPKAIPAILLQGNISSLARPTTLPTSKDIIVDALSFFNGFLCYNLYLVTSITLLSSSSVGNNCMKHRILPQFNPKFPTQQIPSLNRTRGQFQVCRIRTGPQFWSRCWRTGKGNGDGGDHGNNWTTSILLFVLWVGLLFYVFRMALTRLRSQRYRGEWEEHGKAWMSELEWKTRALEALCSMVKLSLLLPLFKINGTREDDNVQGNQKKWDVGTRNYINRGGIDSVNGDYKGEGMALSVPNESEDNGDEVDVQCHSTCDSSRTPGHRAWVAACGTAVFGTLCCTWRSLGTYEECAKLVHKSSIVTNWCSVRVLVLMAFAGLRTLTLKDYSHGIADSSLYVALLTPDLRCASPGRGELGPTDVPNRSLLLIFVLMVETDMAKTLHVLSGKEILKHIQQLSVVFSEYTALLQHLELFSWFLRFSWSLPSACPKQAAP
ncbi:hypothetical protein HPP92_027527 [Vanilla planifolia]|uniref:Uncharacterized protein n=1 Tax=Vanilla planifolia TaxID=51239 RepID=A0A835PAY8_VANPL|nr:hypothetical protein HPP92_027527 [Vanilla planifolia]